MSKKHKSILIILLVTTALMSFHFFELGEYLSLEWLKQNGDELLSKAEVDFTLYGTIYFIIYVLVTALSLPGAAVMTLAGGFIFGLIKGTILVSFASTIGASIAFLASRFVLRDWVESKFRSKMAQIKQGIEKEGKIYLLSLRLIPIFPFFLINLVMGLTPMKLSSFYWVSQLGMLPGTLVYVNAGKSLSEINSLGDILNPNIILSFTLLGVFPLIANFFFELIKTRKLYRHWTRPKKFDYNMIVIGAGSGGLVSSLIASTVKAKVALIEKNKMGGDCLNTGCVPSKALIKSAKVAYTGKTSKNYGVQFSGPAVDFKRVMQRVQEIITKIEPHDSIERYTSMGVECFQGEAKIKSPFEVEVNGQILTTKNIVIATGASPLIPPIPGVNEIETFTSETLWKLERLPKKLLVLGGGPIGCEMAQAFQRLGSEVTIMEMGDRLMRVEDPDVSEFVEKRFTNEGIRVLTNHTAQSFEKTEQGFTLSFKNNNDTGSMEFECAILALGRKANINGFGLEELGVKIADNGTISHNGYLQTNLPNIYVCGDVAGPFQFTHAASHQAWYASVNALFSPFVKFKADYSVLPWCTFTDPEIARVGLSEEEAKAKGIDYELTSYGIDDLDRAIADSEDYGFVKVLTEKGKDKILGACIVGSRAADMIAEFALAKKHGLGLNKIMATVHLYPSYSEALKFAAGNWKKARKPEGLLRWVEKYHNLRR